MYLKMSNLLTAARNLTLAQARLIDRCSTVVKFVTFGLGQILTYLN